MLLLSIERVRVDAKSSFSNTISGTDLIVGARTGDIRLLVLLRVQLAADFPMMRVNFFVRNRNEIKEGLATGEYQFVWLQRMVGMNEYR